MTLFTVVMGLCGFTLALRAGEAAMGLGHLASEIAHWFTMAIFATIAIGYLAKLLRHPDAVRRNGSTLSSSRSSRPFPSRWC